jgi:hypothetical protein
VTRPLLSTSTNAKSFADMGICTVLEYNTMQQIWEVWGWRDVAREGSPREGSPFAPADHDKSLQTAESYETSITVFVP